MDENRVIGYKNKLPWNLPSELRYFRETTKGKPVIMGRKTYQSIGMPLPNRTNIVVTRATNLEIPGCVVVHSVAEAIQEARGLDQEEIFIIGGAEVYKETLPLADRLYVTKVGLEVDGDTFFPEYSNVFTKKISEKPGEHEGLRYSYLILER